jgi:hypothetical protein
VTIVARFATEDELDRAAAELRAAGLAVETYTPKPPKDVSEDRTSSPMPLIIFIAGMLGVTAGFGMEVWANTVSWPWDIGGRPPLSWPAFVPIAFEIGCLSAVAAGFFGFFIVSRMPRLHEPIDECVDFRRATRDAWFAAISGDDRRAREALVRLQPEFVEELRA